MYQYIIRRILVFIPMLLALSIIVFGLAKAGPKIRLLARF